ncbi:hypothetical protein B0H14DRAFT_2635234 [Mycena olivaceomarginata]|nr:hypothetical protein B0H14DRAFT_2635234 [Mycena olivaceomarginata]
MASLPFRLVTCSISGQFWWLVAERHWLYNCGCLSLPHVRNGWYPAQNCELFFLNSSGRWLKGAGFTTVLVTCLIFGQFWCLPHVRNGWYPTQNYKLFFLSGGRWLKGTGFTIVFA